MPYAVWLIIDFAATRPIMRRSYMIYYTLMFGTTVAVTIGRLAAI
jgi:hypothetical protein